MSIGGSVPLNLGLYIRKILSSTSVDCILYKIVTSLVIPFTIGAALVLVARNLDILGKWPASGIGMATQSTESIDRVMSVD